MSQSHKFPKRTSSKQTSGLFEPAPWLTIHWLQEPHQESHKLKVLLCIYWELLQPLGTLSRFHCGGNAVDGLLIFLMYRWTRMQSFTVGCVELETAEKVYLCQSARKKKRKTKGETLFLIAGAFKIGANYHVKHNLNKWTGLLWLPDTDKSDRNSLQSMNRHDCSKKGRKRSGDISLQCFFSEVSCYHLNSMITNLLHFPARICWRLFDYGYTSESVCYLATSQMVPGCGFKSLFWLVL